MQQPAAVRMLGARWQQDLNEARMIADPLDLTGSKAWNLTGDHDRGAEAWVTLQPFGNLPVVDRTRECYGRIRVMQTVNRVQAVEDRVIHPGRVQHLFLQQTQAGAGRFAIRRSAAWTGRD